MMSIKGDHQMFSKRKQKTSTPGCEKVDLNKRMRSDEIRGFEGKNKKHVRVDRKQKECVNVKNTRLRQNLASVISREGGS